MGLEGKKGVFFWWIFRGRIAEDAFLGMDLVVR
jgi:hypothetical protein